MILVRVEGVAQEVVTFFAPPFSSRPLSYPTVVNQPIPCPCCCIVTQEPVQASAALPMRCGAAVSNCNSTLTEYR